jgi:hypothetical protein
VVEGSEELLDEEDRSLAALAGLDMHLQLGRQRTLFK